MKTAKKNAWSKRGTAWFYFTPDADYYIRKGVGGYEVRIVSFWDEVVKVLPTQKTLALAKQSTGV